MKKLLCVLFSIGFLAGLSAGEKINVSFNYEAGILDGVIQEFVYYIAAEDDLRELSQLDWDLYRIPFGGFNLELETKHGFSASGAIRIGIPRQSLYMQDYDWQNCIAHMEDNWLTNYSIHYNYLDSYYKLSAQAGWKISLPFGLYIKPDVFASNEMFSFYAEKGYGYYGDEYPDSTLDEPHCESAESKKEKCLKGLSKRKQFKGKVISYYQNKNYAGGGLTLGWIFRDFDMSVRGGIRYADILAEDHHLARTEPVKFTDLPSGFGGYEADGNIKWNINDRNALGFSVSWDYQPMILGPDYWADEDKEEWNLSNDVLGGSAGQYLTFRLSYSLLLN